MKNLRDWRIVFMVCCLVYIGWMLYIGTFEFVRINNQYNRIIEKLDKDNLRSAAVAELTKECLRRTAKGEEGDCSSWSLPMIKTREEKIAEHVEEDREKALGKMVMFYTVFVFIFIIAPPLMLYLLIIAIIKIFLDVKIVR